MQITLLLECTSRAELRSWLADNHLTTSDVWVTTYRFKPKNDMPQLPYIDVVEEALCFGWIDSTLKRLPDGRLAQRISPRRRNSHWTQLNIERCRQLITRGLMTPSGIKAMPNEF